MSFLVKNLIKFFFFGLYNFKYFFPAYEFFIFFLSLNNPRRKLCFSFNTIVISYSKLFFKMVLTTNLSCENVRKYIRQKVIKLLKIIIINSSKIKFPNYGNYLLDKYKIKSKKKEKKKVKFESKYIFKISSSKLFSLELKIKKNLRYKKNFEGLILKKGNFDLNQHNRSKIWLKCFKLFLKELLKNN
jgi:hypothetical protein